MRRDATGLARQSGQALWAGDKASQGLGMEVRKVGLGRGKLAMTLTEGMVNAHRLGHGGFIFTLIAPCARGGGCGDRRVQGAFTHAPRQPARKLAVAGAYRMLAAQLTTVVAALFTGAAIYINVAEQPARLALADGPMLSEWRESYRRATIMQAGLALLGGALGCLAAYQATDWRWLLAALLLMSNWPYTLICIKPSNDALNRRAIAGGNDGDARRLIVRWGRLHAGRSVLGTAAVLVAIWAQS